MKFKQGRFEVQGPPGARDRSRDGSPGGDGSCARLGGLPREAARGPSDVPLLFPLPPLLRLRHRRHDERIFLAARPAERPKPRTGSGLVDDPVCPLQDAPGLFRVDCGHWDALDPAEGAASRETTAGERVEVRSFRHGRFSGAASNELARLLVALCFLAAVRSGYSSPLLSLAKL